MNSITLSWLTVTKGTSFSTSNLWMLHSFRMKRLLGDCMISCSKVRKSMWRRWLFKSESESLEMQILQTNRAISQTVLRLWQDGMQPMLKGSNQDCHQIKSGYRDIWMKAGFKSIMAHPSLVLEVINRLLKWMTSGLPWHGCLHLTQN
jgi:hypothetical protein